MADRRKWISTFHMLALTTVLIALSPDARAALQAERITAVTHYQYVAHRVELVAGDWVLMADRLEYNLSQNSVRAVGNVSTLPPSGVVEFSDSMILQGPLRDMALADLRAGLGNSTTGSTAYSTPPEATPKAPAADDREQPVLLEASQIDYDHENQIVMASNRVEIVQGETIVLSDRVIYYQQTGKVVATGNVSMLEASGHVLFADEIELKDDMHSGVIRAFSARMADNSLFAAAQANKLDEERLELFKAVYSPCRVTCDEGQSRAPLWQLTAERVYIDNEAQEVTYDNAFFEAFGIPVAYAPYFSHPTPDAPSKSGFLTPQYKNTQNLGSVIRTPYFFAIAPDRDLTVSPMFTSSAGQVLIGDYRQKFDSGYMRLGGSATSAPDIDTLGNRAPGRTFRGDISADAKFTIDETYSWGFDGRRSSDDTYLRRYQFTDSSVTALTSRIYAQGLALPGLSERSYARVDALAFQGQTSQDNADVIPSVAPRFSFYQQTEPGWNNSRFSVEAGAVSLFRDLGANSRRLSSAVGWMLPHVTADGQVFEFSTRFRTDIYDVSNVQIENNRSFDGTVGRMVPEANLLWRFPFFNAMESTHILIEPVVLATISPNGGNPITIPNEDSLSPEFTDSNLFSPNRYAGYDRIESGSRLAYGLRGQVTFDERMYVDWLLGQQYRAQNDVNFPISNDLESHSSDYIGKIGIEHNNVNVDYSFRLDQDTMAPRRSELVGGINLSPLTLGASYVFLDNDPIFSDREQVSTGATLALTKYWSINGGLSRDLLIDQYVTTHSGVVYRDECTMLSLTASRNFTRDRDVRPETSFTFLYSLKNLE